MSVVESEQLMNPLSNEDVIDSVDILTSVLDPITNSTVSTKFNIESRGFLDKDARLIFNVSHDGNKGDCALNNQTGGLSAIRRVVLKYGNVVVHDINYLSYVSSRRQVSKNLERRMGRDKYRYGVNPAWEYTTNGQLRFDPDEYQNSDQGNTPDGWRFAISEDPNKPTQVSVPLRELLPVFRNKMCQFPLYALKNEYQLNLEVYWASASDYVVASSDQDGTQQQPQALPTITISDPQLVLNYIYYPDNIINEYNKFISSQNGYVVYYKDIIHNQSYVPQVASGTNKTTHIIQMNNQELHKMSVAVEPEDNNPWFARSASHDLPNKSFNLRINDKPYFSEDVVNKGHYHYLWTTADGRLFLKNGQYSCDRVKTESLPCATQGLGLIEDAQAQLNFTVIDFRKDKNEPLALGNGLKVNLAPVELELSFDVDTDAYNNSNKSFTLHIHSEITKLLQIKNGNVEVSF